MTIEKHNFRKNERRNFQLMRLNPAISLMGLAESVFSVAADLTSSGSYRQPHRPVRASDLPARQRPHR
jgi:hypothetical protein